MTALEAFLEYVYEQGVATTRLRPDQLFAVSVDEGVGSSPCPGVPVACLAFRAAAG